MPSAECDANVNSAGLSASFLDATAFCRELVGNVEDVRWPELVVVWFISSTRAVRGRALSPSTSSLRNIGGSGVGARAAGS